MNLKPSLDRIKQLKKIFNAEPGIIEFAQEMADLEKLNEVDKYHARFLLLSKLAAQWNFQVYNRNLCWVDDPDFWNVWNAWLASPSRSGQRPDRKFVAWSMALSTLNIEGDTAECGVFDGATSYLICSAGKRTGVRKTHHAFDSWEGLSAPSDEDRTENKFNIFFWEKGDLSVTQEQTMQNLSDFDNVIYYKGWIPERFHEIKDKRFSFVHIDVDIYEPTRDSLEFFYPRMSPGGVILCDDYGYHTCPGAHKAFDDFMRKKFDGSVTHLPTGQGFIIKR
jgi:hypothetical protein